MESGYRRGEKCSQSVVAGADFVLTSHVVAVSRSQNEVRTDDTATTHEVRTKSGPTTP